MPILTPLAAASLKQWGFLSSAELAATDPYFRYTTLLLHGDGTNGAQNNTFLDSSTNNFTITRNGNTTQGTFSPFSQTGWSNYFDGSGDYLTVPDNAALDLGTGNFTIEAWIYPTSVSPAANYTILAKGSSSATGTWQFDITSSSKLRIQYDSAGEIISTASLVANTWTHVVVVREGTGSNQTKLYINGVNDGTGTVSSDFGDATTLKIGLNRDGTTNYVGYISNARVVKGTAVYTGNFTPSTTPLTAISGTSLLTCQSNRFRDASTNNFAITVNGNTSVQAFSPFAPTAAYSAATVGGSGYFDGSGDYLSVADNAAMSVLGSSFTMEFWFYLTAAQRDAGLISKYDGSGGYILRLDTTFIRFFTSAATVDRTYSFAANTWYHVAVVSSGTTGTLYINGVAQGATFSTNGTNASSTVQIGRTHTITNDFPGYISEVRITNTAVYTGAFTPPSAPLTAVTGTALLCNFTNGGIIDNTAKNVLETVGNAQISTSVKKYGTGSLAFDGTGDYLKPSTLTDLAFGTGDFTIEFWLYLNTTATEQWCVAWTGPGTCTIYFNSGTIRWYANGGLRITGASLSATTWYHIALTRESGSTKLFVDGTQSGSTYSDTNSYVPTAYTIGASTTATAPLNGYIDDLRITKGVARYTANFTPQTSQWQDQ
jgi:hypothetical protein